MLSGQCLGDINLLRNSNESHYYDQVNMPWLAKSRIHPCLTMASSIPSDISQYAGGRYGR